MRLLTRILTTALLLGAAACAHAPAPNSSRAAPEVLESDGASGFDARDLAASRNRAMYDAEKNAVRRVAELFMDETVLAEKYPALEEGLLKTPQLYVAKHKILTEGADGTVYRVRLKVWVYHARIAAALRGLKLAGPAASASRAAFALSGAKSPAFAAAFKEAFSKRSAVTLEDLPFLKDEALLAGPEARLLEAASAAGADLLLAASASVRASGAGVNTGFYPSRADASLKVYDVASGRAVLELSSQANAIDASEQASIAKALASAGELLAQEAAVKTDRLLKPGAVIRVKVYGLGGLAELEKLKEQFLRLDVKGLRLESYAAGTAMFEIIPRSPDPQELASSILRGDSLGLELEGTGPQEAAFLLAR